MRRGARTLLCVLFAHYAIAQAPPSPADGISDEFSKPTLNPAWQWNTPPLPGSWSLTEHPGFLRLHACTPSRPGSFFAIPNVLAQPATRAAFNQVTVKVDFSGMVPGQQAGIAHFANAYFTLGLIQQGATRFLSVNRNGVRSLGPVIAGPSLWLRSTWRADGRARWSYSLDGMRFIDIGDPYQLTWPPNRPDRIGLFTTNSSNAGEFDINTFTYTTRP